MFKLIKSIKNLEGNSVITHAYLQDVAFAVLDSNVGTRTLWGNHLDGNLKDLVIAGYDANDFHGAGPTRVMTKASYSLRSIITKKDTPLLRWFGMPTETLDSFIKKINSSCDVNKDEHLLVKHNEFLKYLILDGGSVKGRINTIQGIVTNVRKDGFSYVGDLSIFANRSLGDGKIYLSSDISTSDSNTATTKEALSDESRIGGKFKICVESSIYQIAYIAKHFGMENAEKTNMLVVNNIQN